ncbi:hypothetical protein [Halobaculum roseum]|uniref:Uncharacterized protein n=1 Tax=Halobaculum roseum TaxID=2175149 RepID=A0ABD5MPP6_9EURY|nr:hypothetical protein [Halobaculum roseum]QZY02168.1 hypothetical protein K6T36_12780 [Halobaculum roseum]
MTEDDAPAADPHAAGSDGGAPTNAPADAAPELFGADAGTTAAPAETTTAAAASAQTTATTEEEP